MSKKSTLISMLVIFISLAWVLEASALTCSRCRRSPWGLCLEQLYKQLKNVQKNVTYSNMVIRIEELTIENFCSPGGNCDGGEPGKPFNIVGDSIPIEAQQPISAEQVTKNGKSLVLQYIPGCFLWELLFCKDEIYYGDQGFCVQYECKKYEIDGDPLSKCTEWYDGTNGNPENCLYYGGICNKSEYDYEAVIPKNVFPNSNTNWWPEPPYCNPESQPLGSLAYDGNVIIEKMWVTAEKTTWDCDKPELVCFQDEDDPGCSCTSIRQEVDQACFVLDPKVEDRSLAEDYFPVADSQCAYSSET